jgi:hypothetical protein
MNPADCDLDFSKAVPLMGPAGSMTIHHARLVHGSALNRSNRQRRLLLHEYTGRRRLAVDGHRELRRVQQPHGGRRDDDRAAHPAGAGPAAAAAGRTTRGRSTRTSAARDGASSRRSRTPVSASLSRRSWLVGAAALLLPTRAFAAEQLHIGAGRGTIDFSIGDSRIFRTTGSFKDWQGAVTVDDADVPRSSVSVKIKTTSIEMLDAQQTAMLKDVDFFNVAKFPR